MKQGFLFLSSIILMFITTMNAQVYEGNISLSTQSEVDDFNYTIITGNLRIDETISGDIVNLNGLSQLEFVGGSLTIFLNSALTSLDGLNNLNSVGGSISINGNLALNSIVALSNLVSIGGDLSIAHTPVLTSLNGLSGLTSIRSLSLHSVSALSDIQALSSLSVITENITINGCIALQNLNGLDGITSIGGNLDLNFNGFVDLTGLHNLSSVGGFVQINELDNLTNVYSLSNLQFIASHLTITRNNVLADLGGLSNLETIGGDLKISNNSLLSIFCGLYELLKTNGLLGDYEVSDNAANPTIQEIINGGSCLFQEAIEEIENLIENLPLNTGNKNALLSKLYNALARYSAGNYNAALNILNAFINQLYQFIANGTISQADAQSLIDYTNQLIDEINSSLPKTKTELTSMPEEFALHQNYPNPFNPSTTISWQLPGSSHQTLKIYDVLGNEIVVLVDDFREAGFYSVNFDATGLSSGIYFYTLQAEGFTQTKKLLLMK